MSGATLERHVIDCDADPRVLLPYNSILEHQKGGQLVWDKEAQREALYLSENQQGGKFIEGFNLLQELKAKNIPALNANVHDYLRANQHLIPEEWQDKVILFLGTVFYQHRVGSLKVHYLFYENRSGRWYSRDLCLGEGLGDFCRTAIRPN